MAASLGHKLLLVIAGPAQTRHWAGAAVSVGITVTQPLTLQASLSFKAPFLLWVINQAMAASLGHKLLLVIAGLRLVIGPELLSV